VQPLKAVYLMNPISMRLRGVTGTV